MSLSQSTIKFISSLQQKKFRQNYHKFTVEGTKIVGELLQQQRYKVDNVYATASWLAENLDDYQSSNGVNYPSNDFQSNLNEATTPPNPTNKQWQQTPPITEVSDNELKRISALKTPNQVLAVVNMIQSEDENASDTHQHGYFDSQNTPSEGWSLYLDGLQSPANLGAILRVADWFGFHHVFAGPGTVDLYNPKSIQATMGCFLRLNYREAELTAIADASPELPIFAADLSGENVYTFDAPKSGLLVIGNEGRGIRPATRQFIKQYLNIPRAAGRKAESLNAAVATGILCGALARKF